MLIFDPVDLTIEHAGAAVDISNSQIALFAVGIFAVINLASAIAVWWDKRRALRGEWRVKEETLLVWALVGGWPAGVWAMRRFRHKTKKGSFIAKFVIAVVLNLGAVGAIVFALIA
jgi:uncharacterized membrane protein YsdA (DUF1294 family)